MAFDDVVQNVIKDKKDVKDQGVEPTTLMESSFTAAAYLVGLQLATRVLTFVLNQALLRWSTPQVFGTVSIQLDLLLHTTLFIAREPMRDAVLRLPPANFAQAQFKNTTWLPVLFGIPLAWALALVYMATSSLNVRIQPGFNTTVVAYAFSASFELLAEPCFLRARAKMDTQTRVRIEGAAVILKSVAVLVVLWRVSEQHALYAFAFGQYVYGFAVASGYWMTAPNLKPKAVKPKEGQPHSMISHFDLETIQLCWALFKQSVLKQFLTEGDKLVASRFSTIVDQGSYAVALNYGSLFVRVLFQPIEESARIFFGRCASPALKEETTKSQLTAAADLLSSLLHFHVLLGLAFCFFAPPFVRPMMQLVLGERWMATSAPSLLAAYCYLIPFLGLNGITEAFVQATANKKELSRVSWWMTISSVVYGLACWSLSQHFGLHEHGLIIATAINMVMRIAFASVYMFGWFTQRKVPAKIWSRVLPPREVIFVAGLGGQAMRWTARQAVVLGTNTALIRHFAAGAVGGLVLLATILMADSAWITQVRRLQTQQMKPEHVKKDQ